MTGGVYKAGIFIFTATFAITSDSTAPGVRVAGSLSDYDAAVGSLCSRRSFLPTCTAVAFTCVAGWLDVLPTALAGESKVGVALVAET